MRQTSEAFESQLLARVHQLEQGLTRRANERCVRGLSTGAIEATLTAPDLEGARGLAEGFIQHYGSQYPGMVTCFNNDLEVCLVHLKYPHGNRKSIRTTNLIERSFVEQKRRTKIIPAHVNEKGAMKLVYGTQIRAAQHWQRVSMDPADLVLRKTLRQTMCKNKLGPFIDNRISFRLAA